MWINGREAASQLDLEVDLHAYNASAVASTASPSRRPEPLHAVDAA